MSQALYWSPGLSEKYGVPEVAFAPLIGGSNTRYRPGFEIAPPPTVSAYRSCANQRRLYAMNPRKFCDGVSGVPPWQTTPPPVSHPASNVKLNAAFEIGCVGAS